MKVGIYGNMRAGLATIQDAQGFLQVSRGTVYGLMRDGQLGYVKLGRSRRVPWAALHELVERTSQIDGDARRKEE